MTAATRATAERCTFPCKDMVTILFKILEQGMKASLLFNSEENKIDANIIARSVKPAIIKHKVGDIIMEQNVLIDAE
jgi:hypothetical protein